MKTGIEYLEKGLKSARMWMAQTDATIISYTDELVAAFKRKALQESEIAELEAALEKLKSA